MLFNSFDFLIFFPLVTIIYYLLPHKYRWIHLLLASCVFYCFFIPIYILILLTTILIDYFAGIYIEKSQGKQKKIWLVISILSTCFVLFIFKYFNFFIGNFILLAKLFDLHYPISTLKIILPIGLSFHTFQSLSYVIEVYRGKQKAEKHFGIYSLYVMFYPQLVAGPIERPQNLLHQFYEKHDFNYDNVVAGIKQMAWGMFKKIVIADRLASYVTFVYPNYDKHNGTVLLLATIFFAFQIYCDFSGYSDIAIGCARTMGFKLMTNFNRPYFSKSVSEFWKRWHISLSTWFKDYVYIPLGGNRVSKLRNFFNLFVTFCISGLWHGAQWTYVIWGGLNGTYLIVSQLFYNLSRRIGNVFRSNRYLAVCMQIFNTLSTFLLILIGWVLFRAATLRVAISIFHKIIFEHGPLYIGNKKSMAYSVIFLAMLLIVEFFEEFKLFNSFSLFNNSNIYIRRLSYISVVILILMFGVFDNSQFIYFQF
jgi:alginate O-acetyltransferase complex protein AlgI